MQAPKHSDPNRQQTDDTFFETDLQGTGALQNKSVLYVTKVRLNYYRFHLKPTKQKSIKTNRLNQRRAAEDQVAWEVWW